MTKLNIREDGRLAESVDAKSGIYPITIITEGEGSSGVYTRELLQSTKAFDKGTKSFIDHPVDGAKPWERSLTKLSGKLAEDAHYVEEDGVGKLKANLKVDRKWIDFVEEYKDVIGVSVYIGAYGEEKNAAGKPIVEEFDDSDPYKSVDLVIAAGRGGRFDLAMESYRQIEETDTATPPVRTTTSEEISMEIEELAGKVDALTQLVESLTAALAAVSENVTAVQESLKPAEPVDVDEEQVVEALLESNLTKRSRKAVLEAVRNGAAVEDAIKDQKAIEDEFRAELKVQPGRVFEAAGSTKYETAEDLGKVLR